MRAPSGKNGSNGCFSVFTVHFSVHQVLTSHFSVQALTSQFSVLTSQFIGPTPDSHPKFTTFSPHFITSSWRWWCDFFWHITRIFGPFLQVV